MTELEQHARLLARAVTLADGRVLCRVLGKWKMFVDSRDISQAPYLALDGMMEPVLTELINQLVEPNMVCVDVGACFGYTSLLMAETGAQVFSFEPHPKVFPLLKYNLEMNDFARAKVYPMALGSCVGSGQLALHRRRFDGATLCDKAKASYGQQETTEVKIIALDDIMIQNRVEPDFIRLSAGGYEPEVWKGMAKSLQAKRKVKVLLDFSPRWYADRRAFEQSFTDAGFTVQLLIGSEFRFVPGPLPNCECTLLLTR